MNSKKEIYEIIYSDWIDGIDKYLEKSKNDNHTPVVVAMSRKMPRLLGLEFINIKDRINASKAYVISEHAIPFYLPHIDKQLADVAVADDAMYYGSTFENVIENILWCQGGDKEIRGFPILKSKRAKKVKFVSLPENMQESENSFIPYYTTRNARNIISLKKAIDVEYPIFYFKKKEDSQPLNLDLCEALLREIFKENKEPVYRTVHRIKEGDGWKECVNFSVIQSFVPTGVQGNNDFCKIRIYMNEDRLSIVSYAPNVIEEKLLTPQSSLFESTSFREIWEMVAMQALACDMPKVQMEGIDDTLYDLMRNEYEKRRVRSLVVWANYLSSFSNFIQCKEKINSFLRGAGYDEEAELDLADLNLLIGPLLAVDVQNKLKKLYQEGVDTLFKENINPDILSAISIIPQEYVAEYEEKNRMMWKKCKFVSEALSSMFSNQHFHIGLASMNCNPDSFEKLRFGVSFTSVYNEISFFIRRESSLLLDIHKWMDKKIDEGCVVPKYEQVKINGKIYWKRLFRAGENEDSLIKIARLCLFILEKAKEELCSDKIKRDNIEDLFSIVFSDVFNVLNYDYEWEKFESERKEYNIQTSMTDSITGDKQNLIDYLKKMGYIEEEEIGTEIYYTVAHNIFNETLKESTPLDDEQEAWIRAYIRLYLVYYYKKNMPLIINNLFLFNVDEYQEKKKKWLADVYDFLNYCEKIIKNEDSCKIQEEDEIALDLNNKILEYSLSTFIDLDDIVETEEIMDEKERYLEAKMLEQRGSAEHSRLSADFSNYFLYMEMFAAIFQYNNPQHAVFTLKNMNNLVLSVDNRIVKIVNSEKLYKGHNQERIMAFYAIKEYFYNQI